MNNRFSNLDHLAITSPTAADASCDADARFKQILVLGALHEIYSSTLDDAVAAAAFALMLKLRVIGHGALFWVRDEKNVGCAGRVSGTGLTELGVNPDEVIIVHTSDTIDILRVSADIVNCKEVGAILVEPWLNAPLFNLTASRRLALGAKRSGALVLVVRTGADPVPSAATTRWQVRSAPTTSGQCEPGHPAFEINLLRHRGGMAGYNARVEWDRDHRVFHDAPVSRAVPAFPVGRAGNANWRRAA